MNKVSAAHQYLAFSDYGTGWKTVTRTKDKCLLHGAQSGTSIHLVSPIQRTVKSLYRVISGPEREAYNLIYSTTIFKNAWLSLLSLTSRPSLRSIYGAKEQIYVYLGKH